MKGPATLSLVPDASAWMQFLGLADRLVGGTARCPDRSGRADLLVCTGPSWQPAPARALVPSDPVTRDPRDVLNGDALRTADPLFVIADTWNEIWPDDLSARLEDTLGHPVEIWPWNVRTFRDSLEQGLRLGRRFGAMDRVMRLMGDREAELRRWRERTGIHRRAHDAVLDPVTVISSLDPPAAAAGWTHDVVDRAAARLATARSGEAAMPARWNSMPIEPGSLVVVSVPGESATETRRRLDSSSELRSALAGAGRAVCYDGRGRLDSAGPGLHEAILDLMALVHGFEDRDLAGRVVEWSGTAART